MSQLKESQHLQIPLEQILSGTKNFQDCIGNGGFGMVFKGDLFISGKLTTVAVKQLKEEYGQGLKEFLTEIQLLTGQTHPNLISLLGYCDEGKEKIIVYEYAKHGSLDRYIMHSSSSSTRNLTWLEKLRICVGAACGLDYLHNHVGQHQTIIHRDIKSSNILIDENWVAKISDLGLSKLSLSGVNRSAVVTNACGTCGYIEPEYMYTGIVKKESDVYSFGIVLFEVLCGRLSVIRDDDEFKLLGPLAKHYYEKDKLDEIVDPHLKGQMSPDSMKKFSTIAYRCLDNDRGQRPSMDLVLKELEESLEIQLYASEASYAKEDPHKSGCLHHDRRQRPSMDRVLKEPEVSLEIQLPYASESSCATKDPNKSSMKSAIAFSEPPVIKSFKDINPHQVSYKSNVDLPSSSNITMQSLPKNEIDVGVAESRDTSLHTLQEVTDSVFNMNQNTKKIILDCKKHDWKHHELFELVEEYFEESEQTLVFCDALAKCLKRVRDIRMLIFAAIDLFDERTYVDTLEDLKNLKEIGDPFSVDFFDASEFMYRFVDSRQKVFLEKLRRNKLKLDNKVTNIQTWRKVCNVIFLVTFATALIMGVVTAIMAAPPGTIAIPSAVTIPLALTGIRMNSFLRNYKNAMRREKEVVSSMEDGGFLGINDLDMIKVDVDKVVMEVKDLMSKFEGVVSEFEGEEEEEEKVVVMKHGIEEMKKKLDSFEDNVGMLEERAVDYVREIRRTRNFIRQQITERA